MARNLWSDRPLGVKLAALVAAGAVILAVFAVFAVQALRGTGERTEELLATGADAIATACPFCMTMMTDGVTSKGSEVPVLDISEVVASRLASAGPGLAPGGAPAAIDGLALAGD